jgi:hypothetical protein
MSETCTTSDPMLWTDSRGEVHDLTKSKRLSIGEAALFLSCSKSTIRRLQTTGQLSPTVTYRNRVSEFFAPVLCDYITRHITSKK